MFLSRGEALEQEIAKPIKPRNKKPCARGAQLVERDFIDPRYSLPFLDVMTWAAFTLSLAPPMGPTERVMGEK